MKNKYAKRNKNNRLFRNTIGKEKIETIFSRKLGLKFYKIWNYFLKFKLISK